MRADIRCGQNAETRRTQPNWYVECIQAGIPLSQLPPTPAADATYKEKCRYTWALRKAWEHKTGRKIERLTPPGYNDKLTETRRKTRQGAAVSPEMRDQIIRRVLE